MNISAPFIKQPVMTTLLGIAAVVFGIMGYWGLPVSELPNVDFPTIAVSASLPGADPQTMASTIAGPLENQLANIPGLVSITSQSAQDSTSITLQFGLDRNIDAAAQDVETAIQAATRLLPAGMPAPPTFSKVNPADLPIMYIVAQSDSMTVAALSDLMRDYVARRISRIPGVALVNTYGRQYAVRLQVDPFALAARHIGINDVAAAVQSANVALPTGTINGAYQTATVQADGQLRNAAAYRQLVVAYRNGAPVRLEDVGRAIDSGQDVRVGSWYNGKRSVTLTVQRQAGSNTIEISDRISALLRDLQKSLPPSVKLKILYDRSESIRDAVTDVQATLLVACILVVLVIFLFMRARAPTLIAAIALPISVIVTFAVLDALGYGLDTLSLLALTLAVGFVVDDAIVMIENIVRHIELGETPLRAAQAGAAEISFTIVSMTVSLAAVFIPVLFLGGILGRLLHEFAVAIIVTIAISGIVSVTLTPMLCARLLRTGPGSGREKTDSWFNRLSGLYAGSLEWCMRHKGVVLAGLAASTVLTAALFYVSPKDFLPSEDTGRIVAYTESADRTAFPLMEAYQKQAAEIVRQDPNVDGVLSSVGTFGGPNSGAMTIKLKPRERRPLDADEVVAELRPKLSRLPGLNVYVRNPAIIQVGGLSSKSSYQYTLQDPDQNELQAAARAFMERLATQPGFSDVTSDMNIADDASHMQIDRDRAAALGVTPAQIETALGLAFGGAQVGTIYSGSAQYWVMLELLPQYQQSDADISRLYLTSNAPQQTTSAAPTIIPLDAVVRRTRETIPLSVNHYQLVPAVTVSFNLANKMSLDRAVGTIERVRNDLRMPPSVQASFQGTAEAFQNSLGGMSGLLGVAVLVVYVILGILYRSFIHPVTILSGLPSAAVGALVALYAMGLSLNLYAFVGIIMLIGIVKKNAIMMIDFAVHKEAEHGVDAEQAIFEAALVRFRPIMMTTMTALVGGLPIALGLGAGAEARRPLGVAIVGGLLVSQLLTLYITPVLYSVLDRLQQRISEARAPAEAPET
jgi:HAE1 family hydrophobic/amphiphilic exporter-1